MNRNIAIMIIVGLSFIVVGAVWAQQCVQWSCTTINGVQTCYCTLRN